MVYINFADPHENSNPFFSTLIPGETHGQHRFKPTINATYSAEEQLDYQYFYQELSPFEIIHELELYRPVDTS